MLLKLQPWVLNGRYHCFPVSHPLFLSGIVPCTSLAKSSRVCPSGTKSRAAGISGGEALRSDVAVAAGRASVPRGGMGAEMSEMGRQPPSSKHSHRPEGSPETWDFLSILLLPEPVQVGVRSLTTKASEIRVFRYLIICSPTWGRSSERLSEQTQREQQEFKACFASLTLKRGFPASDLPPSRVRPAHSGLRLFHRAKLRLACLGPSPPGTQSQQRLLRSPPVLLASPHSLPRLVCAPCKSQALVSHALRLCGRAAPPPRTPLSCLPTSEARNVPPGPKRPVTSLPPATPGRTTPPSFAPFSDLPLTRHSSPCFSSSPSAF